MNYLTSLEDINNKIFVPFEINDSDSPLSETDPDVQFYSENHYIKSTSCDYYFEDEFNSKIVNKCASTDKLPHTHIYNDDEYTAAILENIANYQTS